MTTGVKEFGVEDMVIADTSKDKEPKVTTTCDDCQYNVYRMLGEEANIQCAYRDGYKHGYKDGYKDGQADADGKNFEDGFKQGYEQHGKDFILDGERIREDALKEVMTQGYAISLLRESGWLDKYGEECIREAILNRHLMTSEEAEDEFNFEQGKLEGRLEVLASIKDLCSSMESEE